MDPKTFWRPIIILVPKFFGPNKSLGSNEMKWNGNEIFLDWINLFWNKKNFRTQSFLLDHIFVFEWLLFKPPNLMCNTNLFTPEILCWNFFWALHSFYQINVALLLVNWLQLKCYAYLKQLIPNQKFNSIQINANLIQIFMVRPSA